MCRNYIHDEARLPFLLHMKYTGEKFEMGLRQTLTSNLCPIRKAVAL